MLQRLAASERQSPRRKVAINVIRVNCSRPIKAKNLCETTQVFGPARLMNDAFAIRRGDPHHAGIASITSRIHSARRTEFARRFMSLAVRLSLSDYAFIRAGKTPAELSASFCLLWRCKSLWKFLKDCAAINFSNQPSPRNNSVEAIQPNALYKGAALTWPPRLYQSFLPATWPRTVNEAGRFKAIAFFKAKSSRQATRR